jgi:hypothetical protein
MYAFGSKLFMRNGDTQDGKNLREKKRKRKKEKKGKNTEAGQKNLEQSISTLY